MRFLKYSKYISIAVFLLAIVGCKSIKNAREEQRKVADAMDEKTAEQQQFTPIKLESKSLEDLVAFALTNRPAMVASYIQLQDARMQLKLVEADAPIVSKTPWNALRVNGSVGYAESSTPKHSGDFNGKLERGDVSSSLSIDLLVYDFGRNAARGRAASENVIAAEMAYIDEGYKVFNEVSSAYFTLMRNEALYEVAATNLEQYAMHLTQAEDMFEQGEAQQLDVLRARLDLARALEARILASNEVSVAGANLVAYLGINAAEGNWRSVLGDKLGGLNRVMRGFATTTNTAEQVFRTARIQAPPLKIARARLRLASANVDYAVNDLKPKISASLSLNWTDPLWYWRWGVNSVQTIFTGWQKTTALDRAVLEMQKCNSDVEAAELLLSRNLEVALAERDNAQEALKTANESLIRAKQNLDTVVAQYDVGAASRIEFTDAVSNYTEALGNQIKAFYRGQIAEAAIFGLVGIIPQYNEENVAEKMR